MEPRVQSRMKRAIFATIFAVLVSACVEGDLGTPSTPLEDPPVADSVFQATPEFISKLSRGRNALENGQFAAAQDSYLSAVRMSAGDPRAALGLAESHLALGQTQQAIQLLGPIKATSGIVDLARLDQARGIAAMRMKRPEEAQRFLERAVDTDPALWRAWIALGRVHLDAGRTSDATAAFLMAEQTAPDTASAHNDVGMAYLRLEQADSAISHFQRALQIRPDHHLAQANLRIVKAMKGDLRAAMAGVEHADQPNVLNNIGYVALLKGNHDLADRYFRRAIELSPTHHHVAVANLELVPD